MMKRFFRNIGSIQAESRVLGSPTPMKNGPGKKPKLLTIAHDVEKIEDIPVQYKFDSGYWRKIPG